jgi:hypothetical protein
MSSPLPLSGWTRAPLCNSNNRRWRSAAASEYVTTRVNAGASSGSDPFVQTSTGASPGLPIATIDPSMSMYDVVPSV